jgi:hypothetical protein
MTETKTIAAPKPDAAIQQLNLGYNAEQDRLLLRVGLSDNSELLVWLTYRIAKTIWNLLNGETNLPTATSIQAETPPSQAVEQFKQEMQVAETLQKMDFATEYQPRPQVRNDGALLATSVLLLGFEGKLPTLEMPCLEGLTIRINLNQELIIAMCNMLQLAAKEAAWPIGGNVQALAQLPVVVATDEKKLLH